jgi:hypothetical protein
MRTLQQPPLPRFALATAALAAVSLTGLLAGCGTGNNGGGANTGTVAGPTRPAPTSQATVTSQTDAPAAQHCGQARGPEGALDVSILADSKPVTCAEVMKIADQFGPKISQANPETVDGWQCELPAVPNMLARCTHNGQRFGMFVTQ